MRAHVPRPRSRAAVALASCGESQIGIAVKTGISRVEVSYFLSGKRVPNAGNRLRFHKAYGTDVGLWDLPWTGSPTVTSAAPVGDSGEGVEAKIARLQAALGRLDEETLSDVTLTRNEKRAELEKAIDTALRLTRLTGESQVISEAKLLRLPIVRRIFARLVDALKPWPDAMRAAAEALKE